MGEEKRTIDIAMAMRCVGGLCGDCVTDDALFEATGTGGGNDTM